MADRDYDAIADPELVARLAAWFGDGPLPPPPPDAEEDRERAEALARIEAALDPDLVARLEAAKERGSRLLQFAHRPVASPFETTCVLNRLSADEEEDDEDAWERTQPEDITDALKEDNAPQAVLRDLYRPVRFFGDVSLRAQVSDESVDALNWADTTRDAMATSWSLNLPPLPQTLITRDIGNLREELSKPWSQSEVRSVVAEIDDGDDHFRWFGIEGGYDPDQ